ncbi:hypothetical protein ABT147_45190 [Streptomyces sp. NPDC001868]|uniref:hypothetical protein n=1 Tax=Streptomyces sp. NPDC001868 TaxID=3154401 RepID=UPI003324103F
METPLPQGTRGKTRAALKGRTALLTGAWRGIGRATACRPAADGALVAVFYERFDAGLEELGEPIAPDILVDNAGFNISSVATRVPSRGVSSTHRPHS